MNKKTKINKQIYKLETRLEPEKNSGHLCNTKKRRRKKRKTEVKSRFEYHRTDPAIDHHSAAVKKCEGSIRTGILVCSAQSVVSGSTFRIGSRHFSLSVFLHVKPVASVNLSIVHSRHT